MMQTKDAKLDLTFAAIPLRIDGLGQRRSENVFSGMIVRHHVSDS
jgi:hypothetical protein